MIAVDIHGHGDTTGRDEFTFWDTATDIALLLENFNIRNVVICGTSQGGFVATRLALHRPDLVKQIVYAGSTLQLETPESYAGITHLTTGFPYVKENLGLIMQAGFGVDPFAENATAREAEAGKHWISVWNERYSGTPEKEALMQKAVKQLLQRDDIVPRVPELRTMVDVMHVSFARAMRGWG
ncbi:alpha/beta-hydrolase [Wilcoxina mikolae CBS 423.85]|nr:alpha/beta-hydrolase [Wilcoxina mikolae CBS 423.85]